MKNIFKNTIVRVSAPIFNKKYRLNNKQKKVTLISQNCVGGVIYHMLKMPFFSPTINMFIEDENFVKMAENPQHYFSLDAEPYMEHHIDQVGDSVLKYPIIKVDDILLCCQHYKNCDEAIAAWNKRRLRVDFERIFVIACTWNLHEREDLIRRVDDLVYPKVIFTTENYEFKSCVRLSGNRWTKDERGAVKPNLTSFKGISGKRYFVDEFDFVKWINCDL